MSFRDALDNPKPAASRQTRAASEHAEPRSKQSVRLLQYSGLSSQRGVGFPDDVTFNELQPRIVCTVCDHRGADVSPSWLHHG